MIKAKVDEKSKSTENVKVQKEEVVEVKEVKSSSGYKFIRKDSEGKMFLLPETSEELETLYNNVQKIDQDMTLTSLSIKCLEKDKEILELKKQLLERDLRDQVTAKSVYVERKRVAAIQHSEYMDKIRKEVGHQTFGLSEEDEILIKEK